MWLCGMFRHLYGCEYSTQKYGKDDRLIVFYLKGALIFSVGVGTL